MPNIWRTILLVCCAAVLVGCAPAGNSIIPSAQGTPVPVQVTAYPGTGGPVVSTSMGTSATAYPLPVIRGTPMPGNKPTAYPAPGSSDDSGAKEITLGQNGKTISLRPGETFLLNLGEIYQWNIKIDRPDVISRIPNIAVIKGAQGIYKANQAGTATLSADGDPFCRQSKPACMMPSILFRLQIEVKP